MLQMPVADSLIVLVFLIGYLAIIFEYRIKVNKTASALLMAVLTWMWVFLIQGESPRNDLHVLGEHLSEVSQIILFLLGAMTVVEMIDSHRGFRIITKLIHTHSKRKMLWIVGMATFFLSAVLDNLTTTIVMVSLLRKLISDKKERMLLGAMIVIAANAGGAWTPIGDVTTTMLWINGNITSLEIIRSLFLPSFGSLIASLFLLGLRMKGKYQGTIAKAEEETLEPGGAVVFWTGIGALICVPIFKALTGLPPFMGILMGLGVLWLVTDLLHHSDGRRSHLQVPHILTRIDTSGVLFFLGILLCIGALESAGLLQNLAEWVGLYIQNVPLIATLFGLISAVIDNVPLVAASMGMYDLATYPVDSPLWELMAFCAGTGGSILIIGSAAGVALMGMEKIDFMWYAKKVSLVALVGYFVGIGIYIAQSALIAAL
jgi:NhaD family Na+/H+ antiporter